MATFLSDLILTVKSRVAFILCVCGILLMTYLASGCQPGGTPTRVWLSLAALVQKGPGVLWWPGICDLGQEQAHRCLLVANVPCALESPGNNPVLHNPRGWGAQRSHWEAHGAA